MMVSRMEFVSRSWMVENWCHYPVRRQIPRFFITYTLYIVSFPTTICDNIPTIEQVHVQQI